MTNGPEVIIQDNQVIAKNQQAEQQDASGDTGTGNVDKIREILFGPNMREYDQRFARLEVRVTKDIQRLGDDLGRRLSSLEQFMKAELDKLAEKIQGERKERSSAIREVEKALGKLEQNLDASVSALDGQYGKETREIRQQIHDQSNDILERMRQQQDQIMAALEQMGAQLQDAKMDRDTLAALFTEMALRIRKEFEMPGLE